ncbi:hypothetical protein C7212DRAFT_344366 [Tuber magnatum]|uniref:Uncharacterized protein n=1 Tax=Tuber magnatum TaxID=42249 RepID=A0A317SMP5_9PEZI|nr:hypothetical protein C7212DRAFT_344366 [Tuber magnatum]
MTWPLPSNSKETFVTRDQAIPLADLIRNTRGDVYEHFTALNTLPARMDVLELRLTNIEASMDTHQQQLGSLVATFDSIHKLEWFKWYLVLASVRSPHRSPYIAPGLLNQPSYSGPVESACGLGAAHYLVDRWERAPDGETMALGMGHGGALNSERLRILVYMLGARLDRSLPMHASAALRALRTPLTPAIAHDYAQIPRGWGSRDYAPSITLAGAIKAMGIAGDYSRSRLRPRADDIEGGYPHP